MIAVVGGITPPDPKNSECRGRLKERPEWLGPLLDMSDNEEHKLHRPGLWPLLSCLVILLALVGYATWMNTHEDRFAAALLAISVVIDLAIFTDQGRKSPLTKALAWCEAVKLLFLFVYAWNEQAAETDQLQDWTATALSWLALIVAGVITLFMIFVASEMIRKTDVLHPKVLALAGVLFAFLHVTYFLSFALAFSDRGSVRQLFATDDGATRKSSALSPTTTAAGPQCAAPFDERVRKFFFSESTASLLCTLALEAAAERDHNLQKAVCENGVESVIAAFRSVPAPACDARPDAEWERRAAALNLRELYALRSIFGSLECKPEGCSYVVAVRGHANDTALRKASVLAYGSNYEISKQRADQIALLLNDAFVKSAAGSSPAMRWLSYGVSNEESFLDEEPRNWLDARPKDRKLSVEVKIVPVADSFENRHLRAAHTEQRTLDLLDYLYFTVYTITTTGYGDIKPIGGYAKFVVTLANLIELLFVVVIFNVVANARSGKESKGDKPMLSGGNHAPGT